jgi:hypothetical protein
MQMYDVDYDAIEYQCIEAKVQSINAGFNSIFVCLMFFMFVSVGYKITLTASNTHGALIDDFFRKLSEYCLEDGANEDDDDEDEVVAIDPVKVFESKYLDKYRALEKRELTQERIECLKNNFIMATTPVGNVAMYYDFNKSSFSYYSDNVIPYRFLEVLGRNYVCTFDCAILYTNMEDELKIVEDRLAELEEQQEKEKEEKEQQEKKEVDAPKKQVFAKFKNYNKDTTKDMVSIDTKNNNSKRQKSKYDQLTKVILKEKANRYTCEGKISNMQLLKKVDRKVVDKNYALSYAEFKLQMQQTANKNV